MRWIVLLVMFAVGIGLGLWIKRTHSDFELCRSEYTLWEDVGECLWIREHS